MVPKELPRDAKAIDQVLKSMGVDYEPRVLQQLLEFSHSTSVETWLIAQDTSWERWKRQTHMPFTLNGI